MKGFPVRQKMTRDNWRLRPRRWEVRGHLFRAWLWMKTAGSYFVCFHFSDLLKQKDSEIISLLEEKVQLFRGMWEGLNPGEDVCRQVEPFFRSACSQEPPRGASVLNNALQEGKAVCGVCSGGDWSQKRKKSGFYLSSVSSGRGFIPQGNWRFWSERGFFRLDPQRAHSVVMQNQTCVNVFSVYARNLTLKQDDVSMATCMFDYRGP